jgi:predicted ATP-binding protein involved in virulence
MYLTSFLTETRSDWLVLLSMLDSVSIDGRLISCIPQPALSRQGAESDLRKELVLSGLIETIISLPTKIHFSTSVTSSIVILRNRSNTMHSSVTFVDASSFYLPQRGRNILEKNHIDAITNATLHKGRFSHAASIEEIEKKGFSLEPSIYVNKNLKINSVHLHNFRGYKEFSLDLHDKLTVLVGENGAGKTSVLDAIACGLGPFLTAMPESKGKSLKKSDVRVSSEGLTDYSRISIDTMSSLSWDLSIKGSAKQSAPLKGQSGLTEYSKSLVDNNSPYPLIVFYGTNRTISGSGKVSINPFSKDQREDGYDGALDARINYLKIKNWLSKVEVNELELRDSEKNTALIHPVKPFIFEALRTMVPQAQNIMFDKISSDIKISWQGEKDQTISLNLEQLSEGYKSVVVLVIDLVRRAFLLNPKSESIFSVHGVVLIDEIELHLHPRWQQKIVNDLMLLFPNIQFVISTHSPQVLSSIYRDSIRVVDSTYKNAKFINESTIGAESWRLLEDVLGSTTRPQHLAIVQKLNRYTELVEKNHWDIPEALALKKELYKWGGQAETDLIRLETEVRLREFDRDNEES